MKITLEELQAFVAVVDGGSITAAADTLGQTVSGISRALARLEKKLDTTLLRRTTRRTELTEEGQAFFAAHARHPRLHRRRQGAHGRAAPAARRPPARECGHALHAARRGAPGADVSQGLSADHAAAGHGRNVHRIAGAAHGRGHSHRAASGFHPACAPAVHQPLAGAGQPRLPGADGQAQKCGRPGPAHAAGLQPARVAQPVAAARRPWRRLAHRARPHRIERRDTAPSGSARGGHRVPVRLHDRWRPRAATWYRCWPRRR